MTDREALAALLFAEFGWPTREGPGRKDRDRDLVWGDLDNPAWERMADRLVAAGVSLRSEPHLRPSPDMRASPDRQEWPRRSKDALAAKEPK